MKIIIYLIIFSFFSVSYSQNNSFELAKRNIKLGNTYREGKQFDLAAKYINEGMKVAERNNNFDGKYWTATGYEYLGYLYRDMGMVEESKRNYDKALNLFRQIIKQTDGSQYAMIEVINGLSRVNNANNMISSNYDKSLSLNFSQSKLKELPAGIPNNVKSIILRNNKFTNYPEGLNQFRQLEYLDLSGNRIKALPESINNLTSLHYLDLSKNRISKLPSNYDGLNNLVELNLSENKLKSIPTELCKLTNLRILNLKGNKIKFEEVLNLVRCLQNTNIIFDEYQKVEEEEVITGE